MTLLTPSSILMRFWMRSATSALRRRGMQYHPSTNFNGLSMGSRTATVVAFMGTVTFLGLGFQQEYQGASQPASCAAKVSIDDVGMLGPTAEPATGILFPRLCNALTFVGCGVRIKWRFVKVYAVGTYVDPLAFGYVKGRGDKEIEKALLDPRHPRTIRVVMNRAVSIDKYTSAIVEALKPRMGGEDLEKLEEFKTLNPPGDLVEGAVMEMTVRGDTLLYKNSAGNVGAIHSEVFCKALCDVYYGKDCVSEPHKEAVINGIKNL